MAENVGVPESSASLALNKLLDIAVDDSWIVSGWWRKLDGDVVATTTDRFVHAIVTEVRDAVPNRVSFNSTHAFWLETDPLARDADEPVSLVRAPFEGGQPELLLTGIRTKVFAVDGSHAYWGERSDGDDPDQASLVRASIDGGATEVLVTPASPSALVLHEDGVFWTESEAGAVMQLTPEMDLVELAAGELGAASLIIRDGYVYFVHEQGVSRVSVDGGPVERLADGATRASCGIASDGFNVYWVSSDSGVVRAPLSGGAAEHVIGGCSSIDGVGTSAGIVEISVVEENLVIGADNSIQVLPLDSLD